jgi:DNA-binding HxlR family transcriptional regulator
LGSTWYSGVVNSSSGEDVGSQEISSDSCTKAASACDEALARAFQFLGKRWSGVILGTLANGPVGFAELRRRVEGISDSVLSERLSDLQSAGLILRDVQPGPPVSVNYALAPAGAALLPAMHELSTWATDYLPLIEVQP